MGDSSSKGGGNGSFLPFLDPVEDTMQGAASDAGVGLGSFGGSYTSPTDYGVEPSPAPYSAPAPSGGGYDEAGFVDAYAPTSEPSYYAAPEPSYAPASETSYFDPSYYAPAPSGGGYDEAGFVDAYAPTPPAANHTDFSSQSVAPVAPAPMVGNSGYDEAGFINAFAPVAGPSGASGGADLAALAQANTGPTTSLENPSGVTAPAGPSAAGGLPAATNTKTDLTGDKKKEKSWMDTLGITNPAGLATAVGGLALNAIQGQKQTQPTAASKNLAAQNLATSQNLQAQATPIINQGLATTNQGINTANQALATVDQGVATLNQGTNDLRARAASTDPNATTLMDRGTGLTGYVGTGTLPPEMQMQIDQQKADARAEMISKYAARGMPTDPAKNSSLRAELLDLDRRSTVMASQMAEQLARSGLSILEGGAGLNRTSGTLEGQAGGFGTNIAGAGTAAAGVGTNIAGVGNNVAQTGTSLINSGLNAANITQQSYDSIIRADQAQADRTQRAIAAMAAALSGRTTPRTTTT